MLYFRHRGVGDHLLQREHALEAMVVIDNIYIVDFVHILGLHTHLFKALGHTPVLVHDNHLRAHKSAGSVIVIFQEVDDVAGLLHVVDVRNHLIAILLIKVLDKVNGIIGVEVLERLGNLLLGHIGKELSALVLVHLHEHLGGSLVFEELIEKLGIVDGKILKEFGDVGRV